MKPARAALILSALAFTIACAEEGTTRAAPVADTAGAGHAGTVVAGAAGGPRAGASGAGAGGTAAAAGNAPGGSGGAAGQVGGGAAGTGGSAGKASGGTGGSAGKASGGAGGAQVGGAGGDAQGGGGGSAGGSGGAPQPLAGCQAQLFVDTIPAASWVELKVQPSAGLAGIRQAIHAARDQHPTSPVRVRLAPGLYADNVGSELWVQHILRPASAPIWIVADDPTPNATRLGHGLNFVGVSYFAFEGLTIGPPAVGAWNGSAHANPQPLAAQAGIHISGAAKDGGKGANKGGTLDSAVYGQYEPSHHIIVRRVTIQNLFSQGAQSATTDDGQSMDGIKFNQATDVWVVDSSVESTSRHGIDNVGVHRATFCGNTIAHTGGGLGIEAKGGSIDVLYERNVFFDVRRVELGGESTDAVYYFSSDGLYSYEARNTIARNNLIVDAREAALEFSGCLDCAAIGNSVLFTASYVVPGGSNATGGDAIRIHDSVLLGANDGAGSDCVSWSPQQNDYLYFNNCWGVGSHAPAPIGKKLPTKNARAVNNLFASASGIWAPKNGANNIPCPLNPSGGTPASALALDGNHWWNGGKTFANGGQGCVALAEGPKSTYSLAAPTASPTLTALTVKSSPFSALRASAAAALRPLPGSPLSGAGVSGVSGGVPFDFLGVPRPAAWSIGAIEP